MAKCGDCANKVLRTRLPFEGQLTDGTLTGGASFS